jgi:excisionase family DNA binding protein
MASPSPGARFLTLVDVAEVLNTSSAQVYALVRGGDLPAIKIGGRGQWRVESSELEKYIQRMYEQTRDFVSTHRFGRADDEDDVPADDRGDDPDRQG